MKKVLWGVLISALLLSLLMSGISCTKTVYITATPTPTPALSTTASPTPTPMPVVTPTPKLTLSSTETYVIKCEMASGRPVDMQLKTIASWQGTSSQTRDFTVTHVPCIVNYGWTETSQISSSVDVLVWPKDNAVPVPSYLKGLAPFVGAALMGQKCWATNVETIEIDTEGKYSIEVDAVGAQWWLKIGVEP